MASPNILFLMTDQMQGRLLEPGHPCRTPTFDRLAARGVRLPRAYTPNAVCSPARASLMTGRLPHNHGVLEVTHCVDDDQCCLRTELPHWAQRLEGAGYRTGYFGKWHVERSEELTRFGWQVDGGSKSERFRRHREAAAGPEGGWSLRGTNPGPEGYDASLLYGVTDTPPERRGMGLTTDLALDFVDEALGGDDPWCCFVSVTEPHDPFVCGEAAFAEYDVDAIELPPNLDDDLKGRPNLYRKAGRPWRDMSARQHREATACYWASVSELDGQYGRLLAAVEAAGQLDDTLVVLASDHGELLGAHGLYCKNVGAFEEVYSIPMVLAGPGVQSGVVSQARVGLHELAPTLLELAGQAPIGAPDGRSFASALADPAGGAGDHTEGFAEYHGGRYRLTQRVVWLDDWKLVWNGFDFDELYHLGDDPWELDNRIDDDDARAAARALMRLAWQRVRDTGDRALLHSQYPILRLAPWGPGLLDET